MKIVDVRIGFIALGSMFFVALANANQTNVVSALSALPSRADATPFAQTESIGRLEGRLFFTDLERQRMNEFRKRGRISLDDGQFASSPAPVLNGFVKRSDGNTVVWVDGDVRWNAAAGGVDGLQPTDVGGPAEYLKITDAGVAKLSTPTKKRSKHLVKTRPKKTDKPRLLP